MVRRVCKNRTYNFIEVTVKKGFLGLTGLLVMITASHGMSLGRHSGAALIGRPLDLSVQASLDEREDPQALCVEADVFYADTRLERARVRVSTEPISLADKSVLIRIRSAVLIDEPVVTMVLRTGCQQKIERRYVVLADLISDAASLPVVTQGFGGTSALPVPLNLTRSDAVSGPTRTRPSRRTRQALDGSEGETSMSSGGAAAFLSSERVMKSPAARARGAISRDKSMARLKLEPIDLSIEREPKLRSSSELLSAPASNDKDRSLAAALWRALSAKPEEMLRDLEKLQTLEASVRGLQSENLRNRAVIDGLKVETQKAQAARYANPLVYALAFLLLAALAALAYLFTLRRAAEKGGESDMPWWKRKERFEKDWSASVRDLGDARPGSQPLRPVGPADAGKNSQKLAATELDLDLDLDANESGFTEVKYLSEIPASDSAYPLSGRDRADFSTSMPRVARAVNAEELFDVQQQADFFVSLGQYDQAIEALLSHIQGNSETSVMVYLDLFSLYHQVGRKADYEALLGEFNQRFNGTMPPFEMYNDSTSLGLEAHEAALSRIEALWPSPKVLDLIEESIFRKPDSSVRAFDLEAYRELLLLYAVASELNPADSNATGSGPGLAIPEAGKRGRRAAQYASTSIQPLSANAIPGQQGGAHMNGLAATSPQTDLDVDLSDAWGDAKEPTDTPESDEKFFQGFAGSATDQPTSLAASAALPSLPEPASGAENLIDFDLVDIDVDPVDPINPDNPTKPIQN